MCYCEKTVFCSILLIIAVLLNACGSVNSTKTNSSLSQIQSVVRESQKAFENGDVSKANEKVSELIKISEDSLYSESEKMIASYCALYIQSGLMLDYIIKNDKKWLETHNVDEFQEFHSQMFIEVVNGRLTHIDTLREYGHALYNSTREIEKHYKEIHK